MNDTTSGDDRSMSEILASIRKIVTDEEETRKHEEAAPADTDDGVLVLSGDMRSVADEPLDLGVAATPVVAAAAAAEPDDALQPLDLAAARLTAAKSNAVAPEPPVAADNAPLEFQTPTNAAPEAPLAAPEAPLAAPPPPVDFAPRVGLSENDVAAIVRRVVREELQGPIGQQISRKMKHLIRDEIAKALADEEPLL
ncbi:MAG: hypothetical protein AAF360_10115 [Pseudomonadota bacterium]